MKMAKKTRSSPGGFFMKKITPLGFIPNGYGVMWRDVKNNCLVCSPILLNWLFRIYFHSLCFLTTKLFPSRYEKELAINYQKGRDDKERELRQEGRL